MRDKALRHRRRRRARRRPARGVRPRLRLPHAAGQRGLRGQLPARHVASRGRSSRGRRWRSRDREGADAVAHGATGKGNDQVRFELTYAALAPDLTVIAPWREWELDSRTALIEFARQHDIPVPVTAERPYSTDRNLFHISYEGGILEDPWAEPPAKMFLLTSDRRRPRRTCRVTSRSTSRRGDPVAVDGERLGAGRAPDAAQSDRRRARHRARRPRREPLRRA